MRFTALVLIFVFQFSSSYACESIPVAFFDQLQDGLVKITQVSGHGHEGLDGGYPIYNARVATVRVNGLLKKLNGQYQTSVPLIPIPRITDIMTASHGSLCKKIETVGCFVSAVTTHVLLYANSCKHQQ